MPKKIFIFLTIISLIVFSFLILNFRKTEKIEAQSVGSWTPTSTIDAPSDERYWHTAVWTGSKMIVWGGYPITTNTGGIYDPATNSWTAVTTDGALSGRLGHTAVWTGSKMIIWGGWGPKPTPKQDGSSYDPATNSWKAITKVKAPSARWEHTAVWTGSKMIIWGGRGDSDNPTVNKDGGIYDPATNSWTAVTTDGAPSERYEHTAVWTGSKMIIWGGRDEVTYLNTGGIYDPATNSWTAVTTDGAPSERYEHTAVWTGSKMIIWGGYPATNTGGIWRPQGVEGCTDAGGCWTDTDATDPDTPTARYSHTAVWTDSKMIIWGGAPYGTGGIYDPTGAPFNNVSLWAWSENIGWISFNCNNPELPEPRCTNNYGVNIDETTGNFSGYAWSEHIGWIDFAPSGPYPTAPSFSAKLDLDGTTCGGYSRICGWARALSYGDGWDGWIKLRKDPADGGAEYGVWLDTSVSPHQFRNWAWGSDVVGWVSFNCQDGGYNEGTGTPYSVCGTSDYKVITTLDLNSPPYIESGSQSATQTYCNVFTGQSRVDFQWKYKDPDLDPETQFDFRVNDVNDVNDLNPEVNRSFSGLNNPDGTINNQVVLVVSPLEADKITFNTTYYWWVRVWDNRGKNSGWVAGSNFTTEPHAYPWIDFSWSPQSPSINEVVQFTDASECYDADGLCNSWSWTFPDGEPSASTIQNPQTKFTSSGSKNITLTVTDSDNFSCTGSKSLNISFPLPQWKEIAPF